MGVMSTTNDFNVRRDTNYEEYGLGTKKKDLCGAKISPNKDCMW